jgi:hypothetical protein
LTTEVLFPEKEYYFLLDREESIEVVHEASNGVGAGLFKTV